MHTGSRGHNSRQEDIEQSSRSRARIIGTVNLSRALRLDCESRLQYSLGLALAPLLFEHPVYGPMLHTQVNRQRWDSVTFATDIFY